MKAVRTASEDEVVLGFLRGELDSSRFGPAVHQALDRVGGIELIEAANLESEAQNRARRAALADARGWGTREGLFDGFPDDLAWVSAILEPADLERVRYIDYSYWIELSGGSRRPTDVAATLESDRLPDWMNEVGTAWCHEFAARIEADTVMQDIILVGPTDVQKLVLLEGHARITAVFVAELHDRVELSAFVGTSPRIQEWALF